MLKQEVQTDRPASPGVKIERYTTASGKRSKRFKIAWASRKDDAFPIRHYLIDSGYWAEMNPSSRALYFAMRRYGGLNYDEMEEEVTPDEFDEAFAKRKFEYCEADTSVLTACAGIARASWYAAVPDLQEQSAIEWDEDGRLKVYLRMSTYYKRSDLNDEIRERYAAEYYADEQETTV